MEKTITSHVLSTAGLVDIFENMNWSRLEENSNKNSVCAVELGPGIILINPSQHQPFADPIAAGKDLMSLGAWLSSLEILDLMMWLGFPRDSALKSGSRGFHLGRGERQCSSPTLCCSLSLFTALSYHLLKRQAVARVRERGSRSHWLLGNFFFFCSWKLRLCSVPSPSPARPTAPSMSPRSWARAQLISSHKPGRKVISTLRIVNLLLHYTAPQFLAVHCIRNGTAFSVPCPAL